MSSRRLLTYADACLMLGIKKTLLHDLINKGVLDRRAMPVPGRKRPINRITIESIETMQSGGPAWLKPRSVTSPKAFQPKPRRQVSDLGKRELVQFVRL